LLKTLTDGLTHRLLYDTFSLTSKWADEIIRSLHDSEGGILHLVLLGFWICPSLTARQVLFWLLDVGITMHVGRDLDSQQTKIRDGDTIDLS